MSRDAHPGPDAGASSDPAFDAERVHVRLALADISMAFTGRRGFFERQVAPLMEAMYVRAAAGGSASAPSGPVFTPTSPQRFQQFADQVGASAASVEQRAMAFAFYLWNYERQDVFDADAIAAFFRTVHEDPPEDLDDLLAHLETARRWLEARPDGGWQLTTKGVNYVKNRLLGGT